MLKKTLNLLNISVTDQKLEQFEQYIELLFKWNKAYNLTAIRDPQLMIDLHLLDSLATLPFITGNEIIDVGTGPGLPGMVLAICLPGKNFTLLGSNGKKTRFLTQVKMELGINNVSIFNERVEKHTQQGYYDHVISRAFASLEDMINWTLPLPNENGNFLAMKGVYPESEIQQLPDDVEVQDITSLTVTNVEAERHLVRMVRKGKN